MFGEGYVSYDFEKAKLLPRYQIGQPVSVVLICRNKADCLSYVISALACNTRRPDLVVLSDDASTDDSPRIFAELCTQHDLAYEVASHSSEGPPFRLNTLRNDGIAACEEGLVIILDADHVPARTHIEAHLELHVENQYGVLSTGPRLEYANPDCSGPINFMWGHEPFSMFQVSATEPVPTWTAVLASNIGMVKRAILELGGFDPIYDGNYGFDDVDFTYRAWTKGYFFAASFEAHVIHIPHPSFKNRNGDINRRKFQQKYNFALTYPSMINSLVRSSWHDYYRSLLQQHGSKMTILSPLPDQRIVVPMLDIESIRGKILLRILIGRILRKLQRTLGWRISAS